MNETTDEKWLSDEGVMDLKDIQHGKLNIIDAPCGCGKTTFVEKKLWHQALWGDMLYLIDSKNGLEAFKKRGEEKEWKGEIYYKHEGITAMTYATFAMLSIYKPDEWHYGYEKVDMPQKSLLKTEDYERLKNRVYFVCKDYTELDDEGKFYKNKSIVNLKFNRSAQNPITYLSPL